MTPWLAVIGLGEEGWAGLSGTARGLIESAILIVGGARHLALIPPGANERLTWRSPLSDTLPAIAKHRGERVVVLASGDPLCYGVGALLSRQFAAEEMFILPSPSAFSLAAARMLWPLEESVTLSLHGRPLDRLRLHLAPGARILALSNDGETPARVAVLLRQSGWGPSTMTVFEHINGAKERRIEASAADWRDGLVANLNTIALLCRAEPGAKAYSRRAGLPDSAFRNDGQLTKRTVRAATLAALAPLPGELLWDIGAGSGAIAIEWLRAERSMKAVAIERDATRIGFIAENAAMLGVPELEIRQGQAPEALVGLPPPDAIFLGGGVRNAAIWENAWAALKPGGRLVANAVTLEGEAMLMAQHAALGGELSRIAVATADEHDFWRPAMPVTQFVTTKPR